MVCLGNICRSPLAEAIMREKLKAQHIEAFVDSAGTNGLHAGEAPDHRSIQTAKAHQIDITNQKARKLKASDLENFDFIFAMDSSNLKDINALSDNADVLAKIHLLLEFAGDFTSYEVPDPYFGSMDGFDSVYRLLDKACSTIADRWAKELV